MCILGVASIWITSGKFKDDTIYQRFDGDFGDKLFAIWNGQGSGKSDHIVVSKKHVTHVFFRKADCMAFKYLGVIDNESVTGPHGCFDHDEKEPATYQFYITTKGEKLLKPSGTICALDPENTITDCKWKRAAMEKTGLKNGNRVAGIMEHRKPSK